MLKKIFIIFTCILCIHTSVISQYGNFRKYQVVQTGFYCYFPADPGTFEKQVSEDGQEIYVAQTQVNNNTFGLILVLLDKNFENNTNGELEQLLVTYMDYLKESFNITGTVGYGYGHILDSDNTVKGIIDYWERKNGEQMTVKGWVNKSAIAFLYIAGKELPDVNVQELFLNGIRFK